MRLDYDIPLLRPYINWAYFYHAWQVRQADEQRRLRHEAELFLDSIASRYQSHALFTIEDACADGDDIVVLRDCREERIPCLRQQESGSHYRCLADFIAPRNYPPSSLYAQIGLFATSVDRGMETDFCDDPYQKLMAQLLADRLAEATAELMHLEVRRRYWGYAPDERLSMDELHQERFQGIRPAVGYPSLPDASLNFLLDRLLDFSQIGIALTESGAMRPHASVSGLMLAHPEACYFSIGKIGPDQLSDYARRRGLPPDTIRKFLIANL